jgi:uncharacterized protein (TIGR02246 family)
MKLIPFLVLALLFYSCSTTIETQANEDSVRRVIQNFQDDFNEGTFKNAENYTTTDWVHITPRGNADIGRESTLKDVRGVHQSFLKDISMTTDSLKIRFIKPDVALVTAYHTMDDFVTPDNVKHVNEVNIKSYVVVKQDGNWLLTLDHNTPVLR